MACNSHLGRSEFSFSYGRIIMEQPKRSRCRPRVRTDDERLKRRNELSRQRYARSRSNRDGGDREGGRLRGDHVVGVYHDNNGEDHDVVGGDRDVEGVDHAVDSRDHNFVGGDHEVARGDHTANRGDHAADGGEHAVDSRDHAPNGGDHAPDDGDHAVDGGDHDVGGGDATVNGVSGRGRGKPRKTSGSEHELELLARRQQRYAEQKVEKRSVGRPMKEEGSVEMQRRREMQRKNYEDRKNFKVKIFQPKVSSSSPSPSSTTPILRTCDKVILAHKHHLFFFGFFIFLNFLSAHFLGVTNLFYLHLCLQAQS